MKISKITLIAIIYIVLMTITSITTFAKGPVKKYDCKKVGVQKVKPFKFKKVKETHRADSGVINYNPTPKFAISGVKYN